MKDIIVSLVLLGGTLIIYSTLRLIEMKQAAMFPRVILITMAVLSILLLIQSWLTRDRPSQQKGKGKPFPWARVLLCFGLIIAYLFLMEDLGFYLSAFLFFVATTFLLGLPTLTFRTAAMRVGFALVFVGILYGLFCKLLSVQTPKGILF